MKEFIFMLACLGFILSSVMAEDFIVSGNEVFKVEQTTIEAELLSLNMEKEYLEKDIKNFEDNAKDYQAKADALKPKLAEVDRRIAVLNEPEEITEEPTVEVDDSIYN